MRAILMVALAAVVVTVLVACTNPNPNTPDIVAYNERWFEIIGMLIGTVVAPTVAAVIAYLANKNAKAATENVQALSAKVDVQQEQLLEKSDRQTHAIVRNTAAAVEEVGQKAAVAVLEVAAKQAATDEESRDRRSTDKPIIGG
jgi:H+/gluconate symporter-like permease